MSWPLRQNLVESLVGYCAARRARLSFISFGTRSGL